MNIESGIIEGLLEPTADNVQQLSLLGIDPSDFESSEYRRAYSFINEHYSSHHTLPSREAVEELCQAVIEPQGVDFGFVVSEFLQRKLFKRIKSTFGNAEAKLRANDPTGAFEALKDFVSSGGEGTTFVRPTAMWELASQVEESYKKVKDGFFGLDLPWPKLTEMTMGLWPSTATYFVARPGVGKTQVAVLTAMKAHENGKKVLVVSPEMEKVEIAERFFVLASQVSASNMMKGTLSSFEYERLKKSLSDAGVHRNVYVIDSTDDLSLGGIESAIRVVQPDLVIVDSIYMLNVQGAKGERTEKAVDWIRRASKRFRLPFLCFHQMNRTTVKDKKFGGGYDASNIALSDQLLWDAHAVFMLEQDEDMKSDRKLRIHVAKLRRGTWDGKPVDVNWDFENMNFTQIGEEAKDDFNAPWVDSKTEWQTSSENAEGSDPDVDEFVRMLEDIGG